MNTDDIEDSAAAADAASTLGRAARRRWLAEHGLPLDTTAEDLRKMAARLRHVSTITTRRRAAALSAVLALAGGNHGPPEGQ